MFWLFQNSDYKSSSGRKLNLQFIFKKKKKKSKYFYSTGRLTNVAIKKNTTHNLPKIYHPTS